MLRRFVAAFLEQAPALVNRIDEAILSGDWPTVSVEAHALRGQLQYFGYAEEVGQLSAIERLAEAGGETGRLPRLWADFTPRLGAVYEQISLLE